MPAEPPTRAVEHDGDDRQDRAPTSHRPGADGSSGPPASGLSAIKVTGQAFAAVTTAGVGSFLGGAGGTVAGAGIAAIVTTVGDAFYQRSIERTRDTVRRRLRTGRRDEGSRDETTAVAGSPGDRATVVAGPSGLGRSAGPGPDEDPTVVISGDEPTRAVGPGTRVMSPPEDEATALYGAPGGPDDPDDPDGGDDGEPPRPTPWRRYGVLAATALLIFLVAMLAITGIERVKGSPLSGGDAGTSVGSVFGTAAPTTSTSAPETTTSSPSDDETGATTTTEAPTSSTRTTEPTTTSRPRLVPSGLLPGN